MPKKGEVQVYLWQKNFLGLFAFDVSLTTTRIIMEAPQLTGLAPALGGLQVPLMSREAWANAIGLPVGVVIAQAERGYWPQITVGKRVFINVEAVRLKAAERAQEFKL